MSRRKKTRKPVELVVDQLELRERRLLLQRLAALGPRELPLDERALVPRLLAARAPGRRESRRRAADGIAHRRVPLDERAAHAVLARQLELRLHAFAVLPCLGKVELRLRGACRLPPRRLRRLARHPLRIAVQAAIGVSHTHR